MSGTNGTNRIYLDNAATTALDPEVLEAMMPYLTTHFGNPSSIYSYGRETRMAVEAARKTVAKLLHAHPSEIFFTSGGTESSNTAIHAAVRDLGCTHIITSPLEHHATLHTVEELAREKKLQLSYVKVAEDGQLDYEDLERVIRESNGKTLVTLMHANNETGILLDIERVGEWCKETGALFHSDTVQTVGHLPLDLSKLHVDFINGAAHKFHGPKGVGILYVSQRVKIKPYIHGGGQERNMRAGTENIYGIVGFARALEMAMENFEKDRTYINALREYLKERLTETVPGVSFNEALEGQNLYTVLSVNFPRSEKTEMLLFNLDIHQVCASGGSACTSGADAGSHVMRAMGRTDDFATVRFSFCKHTTRAELDQTVSLLKEML